MNFIKTHSKEIAEKYLITRSKKETGKAFGISEYGVNTALYHQGLEQSVSPSILSILKSRKSSVEVAEAPPALVVGPKSKPVLIGKQMVERGIELTNARKWAYEYWKANPDATPTQVHKALKGETGEIVPRSTISGWHRRFSRLEPISPMPRKPSSELTWQDIVQTVPDRIELSLLVLDGFTKVIADLRQRNDELLKELDTANKINTNLTEQVTNITEDRKEVMRQWNALVAKTRSGGHFTIDQTKHILVPKVE